jgi:hypothetical protein
MSAAGYTSQPRHGLGAICAALAGTKTSLYHWEKIMRSREDLLDIARRYANQQRAPAVAITKEILHYEILYAL